MQLHFRGCANKLSAEKLQHYILSWIKQIWISTVIFLSNVSESFSLYSVTTLSHGNIKIMRIYSTSPINGLDLKIHILE